MTGLAPTKASLRLSRSGAERVDLVVIGGGMSGLAAAWGARREGASVLVLEAESRVGGVIATEHDAGFTLEQGPTSMMANDTIAQLIQDLDLGERILRPRSAAKRRYVLRNGQLHAVPMSPVSLVTSALLSSRAKLRLLAEPFIARDTPGSEEESLGAFVERRFGAEVRDYLVDPFVSGVYAGDIDRLSSRHALATMRNLEQRYGSVFVGGMRMMWKRRSEPRSLGMISFRDGLATLPNALASSLGGAVRTQTCVTGIARSSSGFVITTTSKNTDGSTLREHIETLRVIVATPAHALTGITFPSAARDEIRAAARITHAPVTIVSLGFRRSDISHPLDGFGVLAPSKECSTILGALFASSIFEHRAPSDHALITCFLGGARSALSRTPEDAGIGKAMDALRPLLGLRGDPVLTRVMWRERAIPQYELGYSRVMADIGRAERETGVEFIGSYRRGVSVGDCAHNGVEAGVRAGKLCRASGGS